MAKKKNKMSIDFSNFAEYAETLDKMGGDLRATTQKALEETHAYITANLKMDIQKHRKTGTAERSLIENAHVEWEGNQASIEVGFDIANGGLPTIFLMYGTPKHEPANQYGKGSGINSGMDADTQLYNDIYGARTKREVRKIQEEVFAKAIHKRMGG